MVGEERLDIPGALGRDIRQGSDDAPYLLQGGAVGRIVKLTPEG